MVRIILFVPLLGLMLLACSGSATDEVRKAAERGDPVAQTTLGFSYLQGKGVPQELPQAFMWFRKAAEQGHSPAQAMLGAMYYDGNGVQRDYNQALAWFQEAAKRGNVSAQYDVYRLDFELGLKQTLGYVTQQEYTRLPRDETMFWLQKSAEQGYAEAQSDLAFHYLMGTKDGSGLPHDCQKGLDWLHKAANQGNKISKKRLDGGGGRFGCNW